MTRRGSCHSISKRNAFAADLFSDNAKTNLKLNEKLVPLTKDTDAEGYHQMKGKLKINAVDVVKVNAVCNMLETYSLKRILTKKRIKDLKFNQNR